MDLENYNVLKILYILDKEGQHLDRLAQGVAKYHDNLAYKVLALHPKRLDSKQLADFERSSSTRYYRLAIL